ncbi:hypothetical protein PICMEDRAFT_15647 [Pichia membranifaciens NRRL Y-2026]|uniref:Uncharacterized protein n=1 Tax=Pichia membranifaciens NRRL Y-2026 TaxID=763406 RepID=A0A1E3NNT1_9ASCO|nr:hypothetical protein PICMEDRAFT_15647 [Pichia membranifaciens NRRL Y-2026]ODQ47736.1 hypothetical protein PICMEDRAFT_15647 [Pichia membranifaciens NRRL Y-2026]
MSQNLAAIRKNESNGVLSNTPSLSNLYNSTSQKGSNTTLAMTNSAVFNNGAGFVQKGTIAHINNTQHANSGANGDDHHGAEDEDDEDEAFELNWKPQVSSDSHTSGYYDKV